MHVLLRNRVKVRSFSSQGEAKALVHALVSRIDYCNVRLRLNPHQLFLNAAARILTKTQKREHRRLFRRTLLITSYACLLTHIMEQNENTSMFYADMLKLLH